MNFKVILGRVHGGLIATMLDELGLRALWAKTGEEPFGVTLSINVKYRKPVPYNEQLIGKGTVIKDTTKFVTINSEIFNMHGELLANADVKYIKLGINKIVENSDEHDDFCYLIEDDVKEINFI